MADSSDYAARFDVDYPGQMDRLTTFFRLIWAVPILIVLGLLPTPAATTITMRPATR